MIKAIKDEFTNFHQESWFVSMIGAQITTSRDSWSFLTLSNDVAPFFVLDRVRQLRQARDLGPFLLSEWRISRGYPVVEKNVFRMGPILTVNVANHIRENNCMYWNRHWGFISNNKIIVNQLLSSFIKPKKNTDYLIL